MRLMREPATVRLFIALWPPAEVRDAIAAWQAAWAWPNQAALVRPENFHITLHFLGSVQQKRVADLKYVLHRISTRDFSLHFGHYDVWQHGITVLRTDSSPTGLRALHARIGLALAEIGMPVEERAFRPHVTLARRATGATPPPEPADVHWDAKDGFVLVQTLGGAAGYEILERFGG
jgi:RNA 2',3'-cyclic 3'-phosphodiesterase